MTTRPEMRKDGGHYCCCSCDLPEHHRSDHAEFCHKCGKHRAPRGQVRYVDDVAAGPGDPERYTLDEFYAARHDALEEWHLSSGRSMWDLIVEKLRTGRCSDVAALTRERGR